MMTSGNHTPAAGPAARALGVHEPFRGIYPILQTPFRDDDTIDVAGLRREVAFCIEAGAHGLCWPQAGSEFELLTDEERTQVAELLVREARGRVPVIVGVQSTHYWKRALDLARHGEGCRLHGGTAWRAGALDRDRERPDRQLPGGGAEYLECRAA